MSKIEGLVKTIWKPENEKTKLSRTCASIRLPFHKEDIEEFEAQLARAISLLDLALTLNLTWVAMSLSDFLSTSAVRFITVPQLWSLICQIQPELDSASVFQHLATCLTKPIVPPIYFSMI
jgi:hypothetical protein